MEKIAALQECVDKLHEAFGRPSFDIECRKIQRKLEEARLNQGDVKELADCMLALLLIAKSRGFNADTVFAKLDTLARDYLKKNWKKMPDGTYQAY